LPPVPEAGNNNNNGHYPPIRQPLVRDSAPDDRPHVPLIHLAQQKQQELERQRQLLQERILRQQEEQENDPEESCSTCMTPASRGRLTTISEHTEPSELGTSDSSYGQLLSNDFSPLQLKL
jgi:hypothetical protein